MTVPSQFVVEADALLAMIDPWRVRSPALLIPPPDDDVFATIVLAVMVDVAP